MKITSLQNDRIKYFNSLKEKKVREIERKYLIEDADLLNEALAKKIVETILYCGLVVVSDVTPTNVEGIEMIEVTDVIINKLSSLNSPGNFIAVCRMTNGFRKGNLCIALDDVQDPGNGGTILRSALAFNFEEMILSDRSFDVYNDKFIRATKGAFFHLPVKRVDLEKELLARKMEGYKIAICDLNTYAIKFDEFLPTPKLIVVVGSEGRGISNGIKRIADYTIYIPINGKMESLNVAVAASLVMQRISEKNG